MHTFFIALQVLAASFVALGTVLNVRKVFAHLNLGTDCGLLAYRCTDYGRRHDLELHSTSRGNVVSLPGAECDGKLRCHVMW
jgi:hypothetical protein